LFFQPYDMPIIIDAHQDLAYNMLVHGRDYRRSAAETRSLEAATSVPARTGHTMLGWQDYQQGQVAVVFATLFTTPARYRSGDWETLAYHSPAEAERQLNRQIECYQRLVDDAPDKFRLICNRKELDIHLNLWETTPAVYPNCTHPVGLVLLLEGAEAIDEPRRLEDWYHAGLRLVGPVWAGMRYFGGTREPGTMKPGAFALLAVMADLGMTLDISHMSDVSARQALDAYDGPVIASHANARALLSEENNERSERHLTDDVIRQLVERGGVIGVVPYNRFLRAGWRAGDERSLVTLNALAAHIDHICQIAGDAHHVGIGSDFDGGFGYPDVPIGLETIADLQKLAPVLAERGFSSEDIAAILGGNWRRHLERTLPET
ncbi:MAG: membrane dipeptidase, partial [Anaerolineaceae bacterium]|nr:membrane dipeptidase [Anaerolineaceae bacterium]